MDYNSIKQMAKEEGISIRDLCALAPNNDPFYVGRNAEVKAANWFVSVWQRFGYSTGIHLRRIHYQLVSQDPPLKRPNGRVYGNTQNDWSYLCSAGKHARYLGLIDAEAFVDAKNPKALVFTNWKNEGDWGYEDPTPGYNVSDGDGLDHNLPVLPELAGLPSELPDLPDFEVEGYANDWGEVLVQQSHHVEVWIEKTTMNDVLKPLCRQYKVNLVTGAGELSITAVVNFMDRVRKAGRAARILYISDYDPAGLGMPISIARKIEFYQSQDGGDLDIRLQPIILTADQVAEYDLPRTPVKDSDLRKANWEAQHGQGQVELDALEALYPGTLAVIVESMILRYFDPDLNTRVKEQKAALKQDLSGKREDVLTEVREDTLTSYIYELQDIDADYSDLFDEMTELQERFAELVQPFQAEIAAYKERLDEIKKRWQKVAEQVAADLKAVDTDVYDYPLPEPDLPEESDGLLYDSSRSYLNQLDHYKQYRDDSALDS